MSGSRESLDNGFVLSYQEHHSDREIAFEIKISKIIGIKIVKELTKQSTITMSRQAWSDHKNQPGHFPTKREFVDVIDKPSKIYLQNKTLVGHRVHFLKDIFSNKIAVVVIYTDPNSSHRIATGHYIKHKDLSKYDFHTLIWDQ